MAISLVKACLYYENFVSMGDFSISISTGNEEAVVLDWTIWLNRKPILLKIINS